MVTIDGFVLAGGKSSRMGSDKAFLPLNGESLLDRSAKILSEVTNPVTIVGDLDCSSVSWPVIPDLPFGSEARGSIVGLYSAISFSMADWTAILACDLPFVTAQLLAFMISQIPLGGTAFENDIGAILPQQSDGRIQPLCALYRGRLCLNTLSGMLNEGRWRLQALPAKIKTKIIAFDSISHLPAADHFFDNVNTHDDYLAAHATDNKLKHIGQ